jgi:hypothetical protein
MVMELCSPISRPEDPPDRVSEFWHWAEVQKIAGSRFPAHATGNPICRIRHGGQSDACIDWLRARLPRGPSQ